jgi:hypothetical protein
VSIVGPAEARPADGLAVDFVVASDRAQLSEIVPPTRGSGIWNSCAQAPGSARWSDSSPDRGAGKRPTL